MLYNMDNCNAYQQTYMVESTNTQSRMAYDGGINGMQLVK